VPSVPFFASRAELARFLRFGLTGCAGFAVDFGSLVLFRSGLGVALATSTALAYVIGGVVHYGLTRLWVFPHASDGDEVRKVARYLSLAAVNIAITIAAVVGLSHAGLDYRLAKLLVVAVLFFTNYVITPRYVMPAANAQRSRPGG
jgi:putative flippase GtrA